MAYHSSVANGHDVMLQWVPRHCAISGNSAADAALLRAHQRAPRHRVYFTFSDVKRVLLSLRRRISKDLCFSSGAPSSLLFRVDPELSFSVLSSVPGVGNVAPPSPGRLCLSQ